MIASLQSNPERLVIAIAALSWVWMLGEAVSAQRLSCCGPNPTIVADVMSWIAMVAAMMLPTTTSAVRDIATRSYRIRRLRVVVEYISGYAASWIAAGSIFVLLRIYLYPLCHDLRTAAAFCLLAVVWAALPVRARWFAGCHRQIPLCPSGPQADFDALHQGAVHAAPCIKKCWPLMFACGITGHDLIVMVGGATLAAAEKRMFRLERTPLMFGAFALATWIILKWIFTRNG